MSLKLDSTVHKQSPKHSVRCRLVSFLGGGTLPWIKVQVPKYRTSAQEVEIHNRFAVLGEACQGCWNVETRGPKEDLG